MKIKKMVIASAGLGTRLLPVSKELPKEMFPIFTVNSSGKLIVKPLLQVIFEQFYRVGIREFCFIVGRGKRAIEDHFTPDLRFVNELYSKKKGAQASDLEAFYHMIEDSIIVWINQPKPLGFGHAVYLSESFVGDEDFIVAAGDTYVISKDEDHIIRLIDDFYSTNSVASILLKKVEDPSNYGVVEVKNTKDIVNVVHAIEKPAKPRSNLVIMPFYVFKPAIIEALSKIKSDFDGEIQLTDAIQHLIDHEKKVTGILLNDEELWIDIGTPDNYWRALKVSHDFWEVVKR